MSVKMIKLFTYVATILSLLLSQNAAAACHDQAQNWAHIQWSESANLVSPDGLWQVEVHPNLTSDENNTPVLLRRCSDGRSSNLFILDRSADIYWEPDGKHLLVVNQPASDVYKLMLFSVKSLFATHRSAQSSHLNSEVQATLHHKLGDGRHIEFYLPSFVSWKDESLVLSVGGATSSGGDGPMTPYCYGVLFNTTIERIVTTMSTDELKSKFNNATCKISP